MDNLRSIDFRRIELSRAPRQGALEGAPAVLTGGADAFQRGEEPPALLPPAKLSAAPASEPPCSAPSRGMFSRVALLTCCGMTLFTGLAAAMPSVSWGAEARAIPAVSTTVDETGTASRGHDFLQRIPEQAREMYSALSKVEKAALMEKMSGTTKVGLFSVDNREAFIKGKAFGFDVFSKLQGRLDEKAGCGELDRSEHARQTDMLKIVGSLAPEQREMLVRLVEMELR